MLDHRFSLDRTQFGQAFTGSAGHADKGQILCHIDQVRLGGLDVALAPFDGRLEGLRHQLAGHHRHHRLAQDRHEHRHRGQHEHADVQQMGDFFRAHPGIDVRRRHRMAARIGHDLVTLLFEQIPPQVNVLRPQAFALAREAAGCEKGVIVGGLIDGDIGQLLEARKRIDALQQLVGDGNVRVERLAQRGVRCILGERLEVMRQVGI
ncbi:hypothetical protein D3C73_724810 [compost metagenome]